MRIPQQPADWVPLWAREAVFYHIYPLGFLGAPRRNDRQGQVVPRLADLRRWFDHIAGLGVTAIYFGPLFESGSHGYDTIDYFTVDRRLGDITLFKQLVDELHARGLRIIVDGVFHHTSRDFFAFRDIREKGRDSRYAGWYLINWGSDSRYGDGFAYECWEGHQSLPRLNLDNREVRNYIFQVCQMWLGDIGVDGWRLDVAYAISPDFWWEFRRICKQINPDSFLLGELIHGDYRAYVAPDLLDAAINYQLYTSIWRSLNDANYWELQAVMERAIHPEFGLYRDLALFNFLGNHDVTRILSQLKNPRDVYLALIFLLTAPGIPCLYYGDEVGMTGRKEDGDATLRQPMPAPEAAWPDTQHHLYREIARLVSIRRSHPSLIYGSYATLHAKDTLFSFMRRHTREVVVVALNSGEKETALTLPVGQEGVLNGITFRDALDPQTSVTTRSGQLDIELLYPGWGRILIAST